MTQYSDYQNWLNEFVAQPHEYPSHQFSGRGIVICAGGERYFTNAYVCMRILRMHGCELPIQFWHLGPDEVTDEMRAIVAPFNVECVDGYEIRKQYPARILNGWELKPYAIIHSKFQEVIALDADNVAVRNPEYLFDSDEYKRTGAIFWPDYGRLASSRAIWEISGVPYRDEPEFESGQIVVDKSRCWKALQVTMHLNEHSDFYYNHIHGDKETFHIAWRKLEQEYSMPPYGIMSLRATMCQHDFAGKILFQHRNMDKWQLNGQNAKIHKFEHEAACLNFLDELRSVWSKSVKPIDVPEFRALADTLLKTREWVYCRVGHDARQIIFLSNCRLLAGANSLEQQWRIAGTKENPRVLIMNDNTTICELQYSGGMLHGAWVVHEKMPIVCIPASACADISAVNRDWAAQWGEDKWIAENVLLPTSGVFVEVGVNDGLLHSNTLWLEKKGWRGLLVEADARNISTVQLLRKTAVVHCAAGNVDNAEIDFAPADDSSLSRAVSTASAHTVKVKTRRLDSLLAEHGITAVDLLSVDTEGSEIDVLDGLGILRPTVIICEFLTLGLPDNKDKLTQKLQTLGYEVRHETESNLIATKIA
jgi:FkbM family methyltransferase